MVFKEVSKQYLDVYLENVLPDKFKGYRNPRTELHRIKEQQSFFEDVPYTKEEKKKLGDETIK